MLVCSPPLSGWMNEIAPLVPGSMPIQIILSELATLLKNLLTADLGSLLSGFDTVLSVKPAGNLTFFLAFFLLLFEEVFFLGATLPVTVTSFLTFADLRRLALRLGLSVQKSSSSNNLFTPYAVDDVCRIVLPLEAFALPQLKRRSMPSEPPHPHALALA